jgi:hypothetical protein
MDAQAFAFLDQLLAELRPYPVVHFHTFASLSEMSERASSEPALVRQ